MYLLIVDVMFVDYYQMINVVVYLLMDKCEFVKRFAPICDNSRDIEYLCDLLFFNSGLRFTFLVLKFINIVCFRFHFHFSFINFVLIIGRWFLFIFNFVLFEIVEIFLH